MDLLDECTLVGASILAAQELEFALYGIVSHLSHLPEAQKEKRFRELTGEKFLRANVGDLKATLGQLEAAFGDTLLLSTEELKDFIQDRNLIAHNYWRLTRADIKGAQQLDNPEKFLNDFLARSNKWTSIVKGLLWVLLAAFEKKERGTTRSDWTDQQRDQMDAYYAHVSARSSSTSR